EDFPIPAARAAAHLVAIRNKVAAVFPGKEIVIGEFGWPSAGRMREDARPSPYDQARAVIDALTVAKTENMRVNIIEAFDQPRKLGALARLCGGLRPCPDCRRRGLCRRPAYPGFRRAHWRQRRAP